MTGGPLTPDSDPRLLDFPVPRIVDRRGGHTLDDLVGAACPVPGVPLQVPSLVGYEEHDAEILRLERRARELEVQLDVADRTIAHLRVELNISSEKRRGLEAQVAILRAGMVG